MISHIQLATVEAFLLGIGYNSTHFEKEHIHINMYRFFLVVTWFYKSPVKSTCNVSKGLSPLWVGYRRGLLMNLGFIYEQCSQSLVNFWVSRRIVGQKYSAFKVSYNASALTWPLISWIYNISTFRSVIVGTMVLFYLYLKRWLSRKYSLALIIKRLTSSSSNSVGTYPSFRYDIRGKSIVGSLSSKLVANYTHSWQYHGSCGRTTSTLGIWHF